MFDQVFQILACWLDILLDLYLDLYYYCYPVTKPTNNGLYCQLVSAEISGRQVPLDSIDLSNYNGSEPLHVHYQYNGTNYTYVINRNGTFPPYSQDDLSFSPLFRIQSIDRIIPPDSLQLEDINRLAGPKGNFYQDLDHIFDPKHHGVEYLEVSNELGDKFILGTHPKVG